MISIRENFLAGWGNIPRWLFYLAVFLIPIWTLPYTIFQLDLNKSYLAYFLILLSLIFYLGFCLKEGKIRLPKNLLLAFLAALVLSFALSAFFSNYSHTAFLGLGHEPGTLSAIAFFALTLFFASFLFESEADTLKAFVILFISFLLLFIFQLFQTFFGSPLFSWLGQDVTANLFASWNELGIFAGFLLFAGLMLFDFLPSSWAKVLSGLVALAALVILAVVNFSLVWWLVGILLIVFIAYLYSRRNLQKELFVLPFVVLMIALFFILARPLAADLVSRLGIQFIEIRPSWSSTGEVVLAALKENPAFGSGPNSFVYDWLKFRPKDLTTTPFWQVRFTSGVGFIPSLPATVGVAGFLMLAGFLGLFLWYGFKALFSEAAFSFLTMTSFLGALYLWIFAVLYAVSFQTLFFTFLFTGIFLARAWQEGLFGSFNLSLFERSGLGFLGALGLLFLVVVSLSWFYTLAQKYYAAILYSRGVQTLFQGEVDKAELGLRKAAGLDPQDRYLRTLTDVGMVRLQQIINRTDLPQDEARAQFQNTLGAAIQNAQAAVNLNSFDPLNWMNLGRIYEAILPFRIQGAAEFAKNAYAQALNYFPTSPEPYLAQARVELLENKQSPARDFLLKAIEVKGDYAPAHFLLAQLEAQSGNLSRALSSAETTVLLSPNDLGALFQLGLLYYQGGRFDDSRLVFERAATINPNYSNARYFLGLIYDRAGEKEKALQEFERILNLNPGNNEVRRIIQNLKEGKRALQGISPPAPAPERRPQVPVEEKAAENVPKR